MQSVGDNRCVGSGTLLLSVRDVWPFRSVLLLCLVLFTPFRAFAQSIVLDERDAVLWRQDAVVSGTTMGVSSAVLHRNGEAYPFEAPDGVFEVPIVLEEGVNAIVGCSSDGSVCSDTLVWELGYRIRPELLARAVVSGSTVNLFSEVLENPLGELTYDWIADSQNPELVVLTDNGETASFTLPDGAREGEYYFDLVASHSENEAARARTFITVTADSVFAFDIETDHASWVDQAVLYEIAPWYFGRYWRGQQLRMIAEKVPEIAALGVTAIWLQPITQSRWGGQAYDVTDYFRVWDELGTEEDLRALVDEAHAHGLRVLLDIVPNHSSIHHPYAQDAAERGGKSYYFNFYQRLPDGAPYSDFYTEVREGNMTFLTYFWPELVMLNYRSSDVERHITEASRYWMEEFGIDGYRFDAVWGVHARDPQFTARLRSSLKRIKPEILMLAEAKAPRSTAYPADFPSVFESFDVAYDWRDAAWCVSYWSWALECLYSAYEGGMRRSIFNHGLDSQRSNNLRAALTNGGKGFPEDAKVLRFLENNDVPRFRAQHSLGMTKMAAALMFSLPGIPMLYYGQESGVGTQWPTFPSNRTIRSYDDEELWPYYQYLIGLRKRFPSLTSDNFEELTLSAQTVSGQSYAYHRWEADEHLVGIVNMGGVPVQAYVDVTAAVPAAVAETDYYLTDLLSGDVIVSTGSGLQAVPVSLESHSAALYAVADSAVHVDLPGATSDDRSPVSEVFDLQVYPNPVESYATIQYTVATSGRVDLKVYDLLGRAVAVLVDGTKPSGRYRTRLGAGALSSGVYVFRLEVGGTSVSRSVIVVR